MPKREVPHSARNRIRIPDAEMKRRWPTGVLRPRVKAYKNDGGKLAEQSASVMLYSIDQLLTKCSGELSFPGGGARRIFNMQGREVTKLEHFADDEFFEGEPPQP